MSKRSLAPVATVSSCASRRATRNSTRDRRDSSCATWMRARSPMSRNSRRAGAAAAWLGLTLLTIGCTQKMAVQPYYRPYAASDVFADGSSARPLPADTVARGQLGDDTLLFTGKDDTGQDS